LAEKAASTSCFCGVLSLSKDKSPYKTQMDAAIGREGRRSPRMSLYVHLEPGDGSFVANGLYEPDKEQLERMRRAIAADPQSLRDLLAAPNFVHWFGAMDGDQLKTAPQGYDREHPAIDLLRYRQFLAMHRLPDAEVVEDGLLARIMDAYDAMQPFLRWLDEAALG
jgi:uncharacterized protein (TIGR02453 family)